MILLPTTGVGSFPKPSYVKGAYGFLDEDSRKATRDFIRRQEDIGIGVLVDGELYRGDMATDYARVLGLPISEWTRSYGNRFWRKGIVDRNLEWQGPMQTEQFEFAQSLTQKPVKGMLTGPTTLANWNFDSFYNDREKLIFAWAEIIRKELESLEKAGARFIQVDEPAIAERFWETDLFREGLNRVTQGSKAYTITHICYGNFDLVYFGLRNLPIDQIDIELAQELDRKDSSLLSRIKEDPLTKYKDIAVGVIDVRPGIPVEPVDLVRRRIEKALEILAPDDEHLKRIWIKPDCGFRTTKDADIAYKKMETMVEAVRQVRESL